MPIGDYFSGFDQWMGDPQNAALLGFGLAQASKLFDPQNTLAPVATQMAQGIMQNEANKKTAGGGTAPTSTAPGQAPAPTKEELVTDAYIKKLKANKDYFGLSPEAGREGLVSALNESPGQYFLDTVSTPNPTFAPRAFSEGPSPAPSAGPQPISTAAAMILGPEGVQNAWKTGVEGREAEATNAYKMAAAQALDYDRSETAHLRKVAENVAAVEAQNKGLRELKTDERAYIDKQLAAQDLVPLPKEIQAVTGFKTVGAAARAGSDVLSAIANIHNANLDFKAAQMQIARMGGGGGGGGGGISQNIKWAALLEKINVDLSKMEQRPSQAQWAKMDRFDQMAYQSRGLFPRTAADDIRIQQLRQTADNLGVKLYGKDYLTVVQAGGGGGGPQRVVTSDELRRDAEAAGAVMRKFAQPSPLYRNLMDNTTDAWGTYNP